LFFTIKPFNMKKIFILFAGILLSYHSFSQNWLLTGNSGTTPPTNFLGTKDAQRLVFKTDSIERMTILATGNVGIGTSSPQEGLHYFNNTNADFAISGSVPVLNLWSGLTSNPFSNGQLGLTKNQLSSLDAESATYLGDIHPNPANTSTTIDYSLPSGVGGALCQVYSLDGKVVTSISLPAVSGKSQVQLTTSQLAPGMYIYALIVDGKVLSSKKLAVVR
jgi:Secretion system C-terminal sorting domain